MKPIYPTLIALVIAGCASQMPAPVVDRSTPTAKAAAAPTTGPGFYTVKKGDTLYRIALDHGAYYRDLAAWNNITDANSIKEGQVLRVLPPGQATADSGVAVSQPIATTAPVESRPLTAAAPVAPVGDGLRSEPKVNKEAYSDAAWEKMNKAGEAKPAPETKAPESKPAEPKPDAKTVELSAINWGWPATGKVKAVFGENGNKGIDVAGKEGDPISAAAEGKVFFVGLQKGYGNLLIIGHANGYISVYAHNRKILVSEKQVVSKGQKVAEMGSSDSETGVKLHFEIRQQGKPVDPLTYLPKH